MSNNKNAIDMKTNYFSSQKISIYSLFGILGLLITSCGSYQSTSYYDNDGVYGTNNKQQRTTETNPQNNLYKDYFGSLQEDNKEPEVFTDVENYSSKYDGVEQNQTQTDQNNYTAWGSNATTTVVVYDNFGWNNYWNWNIGWGWNSWYGPSWGWNSWYNPYSWNGWYGNYWYGNSWCGDYWHGNNYYGGNYYGSQHYGNGRRDSNTNYTYNGGRSNYSYNNGVRRNNTVRTTRDNNIRSGNVPIRNYNSTTPRNNTIRNQSPIIRNNQNTTPRTNTPIRVYTPSNNNNNNNNPRYNNNSTPRNNNNSSYTPSSSSSSSSSNSNSGSGNGGGRTSGGGRR